MVFADIECLIEPTEQGKQLFIADLIRYATEEDPYNVSHAFSGETCIEQFIQAMNQLTEVGDKQRDLFIIFHNLKGFDSTFIIEELYRKGIKVENQLKNPEVPLVVSGRHDYLQRFTLFSPNATGRVAWNIQFRRAS